MRKSIVLFVMLLALTGCQYPYPPTVTPGDVATLTPNTPAPSATLTTPTNTPSSTNTASPTQTLVPTATIDPTPTQIVGATSNPDNPNLLVNPGFEGDTHSETFVEVIVFDGWNGFYCDKPYTPAKCPLLRGQDGWMKRPEFKPVFFSEYSNRVHSGESAQSWFCMFGGCSAGVYQTFPTIAGERYEVGAWVQSWSNYDDDPGSELDTQDDRDNSRWFILIDTCGGTFAFNPANLPAQGADLEVSQGFGYEHGIYDQFVKIRSRFTAQCASATVFFGDQRLWPIGNNDSYIDDAWARQQ